MTMSRACRGSLCAALLLWMPAAVSARSQSAGVVPDTVRLVAPAEGDTVVPDVQLSWMPVAGALRYDLSLSLTADFQSRLDTSGITATSITMRNLPTMRSIYWRVRAVDASGAGPWCIPWSFRLGNAAISDSVKPLPELGAGLYRGYPGGLYPNGLNVPPAAHLAAALEQARAIVPLDTNGRPDSERGAIVLLSVGMSNTTQEFSMFKTWADTLKVKSPRVVVVDGAQGGQTASVIANPTAAFWNVIETRLRAAGVTARQVQVIWMKEANAGPTTGFPRYAQDLERDLATIVRALPGRYPNLGLAYLSSRIYGGWATTDLNPEMYAYESGFSVKWLIERQIAGDTSLAFSGPARRAPLLLWGPYLWANGLRPRADGLVWQQSDFTGDGTHPSNTGRAKVARMLLDFMIGDTTAKLWFLRPAPSGVEPDARRDEAAFHSMSCRPNPANDRAAMAFTLSGPAHVRLELSDALGRARLVTPNEPRAAGRHEVGLDLRAAGLEAGTYFVRLVVDGHAGGPVALVVR